MVRFLPRLTLAPFLCFFLAIVGLLVYDAAATKHQEHQQAVAAFGQALGDSRGQLASLMHVLQVDANLQQNIDANLSHSLQRNLLANLSHGQLEQLTLFDKDCHEIARASLKKIPLFPCELARAGEGFYWSHTDDGLAVLNLLRKDSASNGLFISGQVALSHDWLLLHPSLLAWARRLDLRVGPALAVSTVAVSTVEEQQEGELLAAEGKMPAGGYAAQLWVQGWFSVYGAGWIKQPELIKGLLFWPFLIAALLMFLYNSLLDYGAARQRQQLGQAFKDQCHKLCSFPSLPFHYQVSHDKRFAGVSPYAEVLTSLVASLREQGDRFDSLQRERDKQQAMITKLEHSKQELTIALGQTAEHEALAMHIKGSALALMERLKQQAAVHHTMVQVLRYGLLADGQKLAAFVGSWRQSIATKGARKFIRSLAETPDPHGRHSDHANMLVHELEQFSELGDRISDQGLHTAGLAQSFGKGERQALQVLAHWYGLALRDEGHELPIDSSLRQLLTQADELRQAQLGKGQSGLKVQIEVSAELLPQAPAPILLAAFYHILIALGFAVGRDERQGASLVIRSKRAGEDCYLLFTLASGELLPDDDRCGEGWQHIAVVNNLLALYQVSLHSLPAQRKFNTFAMQWTASDCQQGKASKPMPPRGMPLAAASDPLPPA